MMKLFSWPTVLLVLFILLVIHVGTLGPSVGVLDTRAAAADVEAEAGQLGEDCVEKTVTKTKAKASAQRTSRITAETKLNELRTEVNQTKNQTNTTAEDHYQPRVTVMEDRPPTMAFSSLSVPNGSVWCDGAPTYWVTGHDKVRYLVKPEEMGPFCFVNGTWKRSPKCLMDMDDEMSRMYAENRAIDRHACVRMDVNKDGLEDIVCSVGGGKGVGVGYNELYITQENGTLRKIQRDHGLQKYPSMSNRFTVVLKNGEGEKKFVFFATVRGPRKDNLTNGKCRVLLPISIIEAADSLSM
jgi:hypothetical protein